MRVVAMPNLTRPQRSESCQEGFAHTLSWLCISQTSLQLKHPRYQPAWHKKCTLLMHKNYVTGLRKAKHVCMHACMYVCYVCMYACMYAYTSIRIYIYIYNGQAELIVPNEQLLRRKQANMEDLTSRKSSPSLPKQS